MKAYQNQFLHGWSGGPGVCGEGSREHFAHLDRKRLTAVIAEWASIHDGLAPRVIEIGCGDLFWHGGALPGRYIGVDLHPRESWHDARRDPSFVASGFLIGDACTAILPTSDLAIARQVFIHLSNRAILAILDNLRRAGVEWILASTVPGADPSARLPTGEDYSLEGWPVDLADEPFCLPYALPLHRGGAMRLFSL